VFVPQVLQVYFCTSCVTHFVANPSVALAEQDTSYRIYSYLKLNLTLAKPDAYFLKEETFPPELKLVKISDNRAERW